MFGLNTRTLLGAVLVLACLGGPAQAQTRRTESGPVAGFTLNAVSQFRDIPYAAPPVGKLRWRPPVRPAAWTGTRDAQFYGPACEQSLSFYPVSEDCLTLNIFAPAPAKVSANLPVMIWIHGGAFVSGAARDFNAADLARQGKVVIVTINYRLGYLGFLAHPALSAADPHHVSGNYGLLDQQAAFAWVRRNIANFGGDPAHLTIFGESAGGQSVIDQLISPSAGRFSAAIAQSGSYMTSLPTLAKAEVAGRAAAKSLGCPNQSAACLYALDAKTIAAALSPLSNLESVSAVVDGRTIPLPPAQAFAAGKFHRVPVINGSNHDEYRLFIGLQRGLLHAPAMTAKQYNAAIEGQFGAAAEAVLKAYPAASYGQPDYAYGAVLTDIAFACNTHLLNAQMARYTKVFQYELNDPKAPVASGPNVPGFNYGTPHSADLSYLFPFYNVKAFHPGGPPLMHADQVTLRHTIQDYWTTMAHDGHPANGQSEPWPAYTEAAQKVLSLIPPGASAARDFTDDHHCALWKTYLLKQAGLPADAAY